MRRCPFDAAAAETVEVLPEDTRLGSYQIGRLLNEGDSCFVYEATHEVLGRRVAIKMLRPGLATQPRLAARFLEKAKAINQIDHQNIVNVYDYSDAMDGTVYFVMELVQGETLDDLMCWWRPLPLPLLLHVFGQIARALAAAHAKQIGHRTLAPADVYIVARDDNPYFVKLLGLGTADARDDVGAIGMMLDRAVAGHESAPVPALSRLIASCLEHRCPSIHALITGLEQVKQECKLGDDAILDWVQNVARTIPGMPAVQNHDLDARISSHRGVGDGRRRELRPAVGSRPPRSWLARYIEIGAVLGALGAGASLMLDRGEGRAPPPPRVCAERGLREAIIAGSPQQQALAVDALARVRRPATAPLLYLALAVPSLEVRVAAALALGELALSDSATKIRAALDESGERLKVDLAAVLYRVGDKDARALLERALEDPSTRFTAAMALAASPADASWAVLDEIVRATPPGREQWRRAAGRLASLGDAHARALLAGELSQVDPARSIAAAELLARAGDAGARELLARVVADEKHARRGEAAVALARLGDRRALGWVARGIASPESDERMHALTIYGLLAENTAARDEEIRRLAADPDPRVCMTAEAVRLGL